MSDKPNYDIAPELWDFLTRGEAPQDCIIENWKPLLPRQAMTIIWILQEAHHLLPDVWEHCIGCDKLFDSEKEYYIILEGGHYCEDCANEVGTLCRLCARGVRWEDAIQAEDGGYNYYCTECWAKTHSDEAN